MVEAESLSGLIGGIYDSALDPELWHSTLGEVTAFVGGHSAGLGFIDPTSKSIGDHHTFGCDPHYLELYLRQYGQYDHSTIALAHLPAEQVTSTTDVIPYDQFREGRFYREWARPQGFVDSVGAVLDKSQNAFVVLSIMRNERSGLVDDDTRRRMSLVMPHMRRAAVIGGLIRHQKIDLTALADVFDGLTSGMFLVDARGRIVHANTSGQALLAEGGPVHKACDRLVGSNANTERALRDLFIAAAAGDMAVGAKGIAMPLRGRDGGNYVAHILPLTACARRQAGKAHQAVAAVFIRAAVLASPSAPELVAQAYMLTPTELRVLLGIVEIGGVPEVAEALGIAETTVKTHLRHLYEKTGARRHADLVKLVAAFSVSPVD